MPLRPVREFRPSTVDAVLGAALSVVGLIEAAVVPGGGGPGALALVALLPLPLLARRRRPLLTALAVTAGFAAQLAEPLRTFDRTATCYVVLLVAMYSLGRFGRPRALGPGAGGCAVAVGGVIGGTDGSLLSGVLAAALIAAAAAMARTVAVRAGLLRQLQIQAREIAASADVAEESAATAVRARLAGEVRDVVERHVGRMLDGARAAEFLMGSPQRAATVIAGVEAAGRDALDEMRRMLGLLREDGDRAPLVPPSDPVPPPRARVVSASPTVRRRGLPPDWLAATVIAIAAAEAAWSAAASGETRPAVVAASLAGASIAAPLVLRRNAPVAASVLTWGMACVVVAFLPLPAFALVLTGPLLAYAAGAHADRSSWRGLAVGWAGVAAVNLVAGSAGAGDYAVPAVLVGLAWLAGRAVGGQVALGRRVAERNAELERLGELRASAAAAQERLRIARELHDVVAHTVMVMVVQAGAARRTVDRDPPRSLAALGVVVRTGEEALAELRRLLAVVEPSRSDDVPGMSGLPALVERARATGLAVDLRVDGRLDLLPGGVDLAAYRIVQEALTNVIRHADATRVVVDVRVGPRDVRLEVRDDGSGAPPPARPPDLPGNGIAGMRERVRIYGGEFAAGPAAAGFAVSASFPLAAVALEQPA